MTVLKRYSTHLTTLVLGLTILAGGLVHATGSSLACPDWPLCFGKFAPAMEGPVLFEHSHRLIAATAGILVWFTGLVYWVSKTQRLHRLIVSGMMVLIVIQAVLGGITVLYQLPSWISTLHFLLAHVTFGGLFVLSLGLEVDAASLPPTWSMTLGQKLLSLFAFLGLFFQMGLGAWLRHIGTKGEPFEYQCDFFPFCDPVWIKHMTEYYLDVYWMHRWSAVLVTVLLVLMTWIFRIYRSEYYPLFVLPLVASGLVLLQVAVGDLAVRTYLSISSVTVHSTVALIIFSLLLWHNLILFGQPLFETD